VLEFHRENMSIHLALKNSTFNKDQIFFLIFLKKVAPQTPLFFLV